MREAKYKEGDRVLYWVPDYTLPFVGTVDDVEYQEYIDMFLYTIMDDCNGPNEVVIRIEPGIVLLEIDFTELLAI